MIKYFPLLLIMIASVSISKLSYGQELVEPELTPLRPGIKRIVNLLDKERTLHFGYDVGYEMKPETRNKYYKLFLKFKKRATTKELLELSKSSSKTILLYTFRALHFRNHSVLKTIFLNHIHDSVFVWIAGGCTGFMNQVNSEMLTLLNPENKNVQHRYLSKEEYNEYLKIVSKE